MSKAKKIPVVVLKYSDGSEYLVRIDKEGWEELVKKLDELKARGGVLMDSMNNFEMEESKYLNANLLTNHIE